MADDEIDCERALVELYEFLDGELTLERRRTIDPYGDVYIRRVRVCE